MDYNENEILLSFLQRIKPFLDKESLQLKKKVEGD